MNSKPCSHTKGGKCRKSRGWGLATSTCQGGGLRVLALSSRPAGGTLTIPFQRARYVFPRITASEPTEERFLLRNPMAQRPAGWLLNEILWAPEEPDLLEFVLTFLLDEIQVQARGRCRWACLRSCLRPPGRAISAQHRETEDGPRVLGASSSQQIEMHMPRPREFQRRSTVMGHTAKTPTKAPVTKTVTQSSGQNA